MRFQRPAIHNRQLLLRELRGKRRAQGAHNHFFGQRVIVATRRRAVNRAAVAPERRTNRADSRSSRSFLLPKLLARAAHFALIFRLVRSRAFAGEVMAHRFVQQVLIHLHRKHVVGEFNLADFLAFEIFYVRNGHRRLFIVSF